MLKIPVQCRKYPENDQIPITPSRESDLTDVPREVRSSMFLPSEPGSSSAGYEDYGSDLGEGVFELSSWDEALQRIKGNDPNKRYIAPGNRNNDAYHDVERMTDGEWEELGRDISNNTHLKTMHFSHGLLNDRNLSFFFRNLTMSCSLKYVHLNDNAFSSNGVRSMVPFLQQSNNLKFVSLAENNIQSEGFNMMFRALRDSLIYELNVSSCGIRSLEIDSDHIPRRLRNITLDTNCINTGGCRELAKLLQGGNAVMRSMCLRNNKLDDEGIEILVDALQGNASLVILDVRGNSDITKDGHIMLLTLVNNISTIEATLQSNHTLKVLEVDDDEIQAHINLATRGMLSAGWGNPACDNERKKQEILWKVVQTQLHSETRARFAALQEVYHSVYSDIDPRFLPEYLAEVDEFHGQGELYIALKSVMSVLVSTVNRKECIRQQVASCSQQIGYYFKRRRELKSQLEAIEAAEGSVLSAGTESPSTKRRREGYETP